MARTRMFFQQVRGYRMGHRPRWPSASHPRCWTEFSSTLTGLPQEGAWFQTVGCLQMPRSFIHRSCSPFALRSIPWLCSLISLWVTGTRFISRETDRQTEIEIKKNIVWKFLRKDYDLEKIEAVHLFLHPNFQKIIFLSLPYLEILITYHL